MVIIVVLPWYQRPEVHDIECRPPRIDQLAIASPSLRMTASKPNRLAAARAAKKVDFCFQCDEFPCDRTGFDEHLRVRWVKLNERIHKAGLERYYEETRDRPRYP